MNDLVKNLEAMKDSKEEMDNQISEEEAKKKEITDQLNVLQARLDIVNENLRKKNACREDYDRTLGETEGAFTKILESSQTLLHVLKKESTTLSKKQRAALTGEPEAP